VCSILGRCNVFLFHAEALITGRLPVFGEHSEFEGRHSLSSAMMKQVVIVLGVLADVSIATLLVYQVVVAVRDHTSDKILVATTSVIPGVVAMLFIPKLCRQVFEDPFLKLEQKIPELCRQVFEDPFLKLEQKIPELCRKALEDPLLELGTKTDRLEEQLGTKTDRLGTKTDRLEEQLGTRTDRLEKQLGTKTDDQTDRVLAAILDLTRVRCQEGPETSDGATEHVKKFIYELATDYMDNLIRQSAQGGCVKLLDTMSMNSGVEARGKVVRTTLLNAYEDMHVLHVAVLTSSQTDKEREAFKTLLHMKGWVLQRHDRMGLDSSRFADVFRSSY
jgi:hypothetical protein